MKYVLVLGDGMADRPIESLGGRTPLEYAKTPTLDALSKVSEIGLVATVPEGYDLPTRIIVHRHLFLSSFEIFDVESGRKVPYPHIH